MTRASERPATRHPAVVPAPTIAEITEEIRMIRMRLERLAPSPPRPPAVRRRQPQARQGPSDQQPNLRLVA